MQGKVEICGVNTARLPVLKAAETRSLLEKARGGDREARQALPGADRGQSSAGAVGDPEVFRPRREHGRSLPGRLHRPHQGR